MKVTFVFTSKGIGGAERSMLRMIKYSHPAIMYCSVIHYGEKVIELEDELNSLKIEWDQVSFLRIGKLVKVLKDHNPDVVYLFGPFRAFLVAIISRLIGVKVIVGAERSSTDSLKYRMIRKIDNFFINAYIANSSLAITNLEKKCRILRKKLFLIYNGLDLIPFTNSSFTNKSFEDVSLICVSNIRPIKGHIILLESIHLLQNKYPGLKVRLLGKDFTNGKFFSEVERKNLLNTFIWEGYVSKIEKYLYSSDIFVLPSMDREGTPTAILEAMGIGLPVIATSVGGIEELVENGLTGLICEPGNSLDIANKIDLLLNDNLLRKQLGKNAREYVCKNHSISVMANSHYQVFLMLISKDANV
jgi:glycosyltransferase involved in cell wall biosynthesis